jgi:hypothetical protein
MYTKGVVLNPRQGTGSAADYLLADFMVFDPDMIADIDAGKREVSCGYNPEYYPVLDDSGEPLPGRGRQRNIIYNHMAVVDAGRCGHNCAVRDHALTHDRALDRAMASLRRVRDARLVVVNHFSRRPPR